jgi:hypothetical protein
MRFCSREQRASLERVIREIRGVFALRLFSERLRRSDEVIESLLHREVSPDLECRPVFDAEHHDEDEREGFAA